MGLCIKLSLNDLFFLNKLAVLVVQLKVMSVISTLTHRRFLLMYLSGDITPDSSHNIH